MSAPRTRSPFEIGGTSVAPGERGRLEIEVARLPTGTWVSLPVAVVHGRRPGPTVWLSAAIHGDELNGIEIVRRVLPRIDPARLSGTVIAVPIVNVFGFLQQQRYLPDRRDLNRSFPGSSKGSLTARLADLFMTEIVARCDVGIDYHTGSHHRTNHPQIRADLADGETRRLTEAFRAPLSVQAGSREGSLRQVATRKGLRVLLYEAGETLRFNLSAIRIGVRGTLRVLHALGMIAKPRASVRDPATRLVEESHWIRAPRGGILLIEVESGEVVDKGQVLGRVADTFSREERELRAPYAGIVMGLTTNPIVNRGDALVHLARCDASRA